MSLSSSLYFPRFGDRLSDRLGDRLGTTFGRSASPMNVGSARMSPEIPTTAGAPHGGGSSSVPSTSTNAENPGRDSLRDKVREIPIKVMRGAAATLNNGANEASSAGVSPDFFVSQGTVKRVAQRESLLFCGF